MKKGWILLLSGLLLFSAGCTKESRETVVTAKDGYAEGKAGDVMRTYFFDYIVNSAYQTKNYEGITPGEEKVLLVVNMTVRNTDRSECEIYDIDFQAQWGDDGDDDFAYPLTADDQEPVGAMAEAEYTLQPSEEKTADLVFEIPQGKENFSVAYREEFADGTSGDTFFTYFDAPTK